ncbi:hypothetical protein [Enterovirga sp.]|uniref:hypothetical protein n=1 Tax=Enterovirga sp. TaxID=2026350 RepID=UPI002B57757D|nr:hypothetical protein [Enterovirga sp.]HMO29976.1 hypothetical protein [Enterovirga sp.]
MSTYLSQGIAAVAVLAAAVSMASIGPAFADEPKQVAAPTTPVKHPLPGPAAAPGKPDGSADSALRRGAPSPQRAADKAHCREQAAKRKLFGLGRHKFLQRCRRARRKALGTAH